MLKSWYLHACIIYLSALVLLCLSASKGQDHRRQLLPDQRGCPKHFPEHKKQQKDRSERWKMPERMQLLGQHLHRPEGEESFKRRGWRKAVRWLVGASWGQFALHVFKQQLTEFSLLLAITQGVPFAVGQKWVKISLAWTVACSSNLKEGLYHTRKYAVTGMQLQGPYWAHQPPWPSSDHNSPAPRPEMRDLSITAETFTCLSSRSIYII